MPSETVISSPMGGSPANMPVNAKSPQGDKPAPTAAPAVSKPVHTSFEDEIDKMSQAKPKEAPKAKETPKPAAKPEPEETEVPETEVAPKGEAPKAGEKPKSHTAILRDAHEALKGKYKTLEAENTKLKTAKPVEDADKPILTKRLTDVEAENKQLKEQLKFKDYQSSEEYKNTYQKPYQQIADSATKRATQLKMGEIGSQRNLTADEFWSIVHIGDENDALQKTEELFGEGSTKANFVIERRNEILDAHQKGQQAIEDYRKQADERNKTESEKSALERSQSQAKQKQMVERFSTLATERETAKPEYNKADEGDEQGSKVLQTGSALGDLAFGRMTPEQIEHLPESVRSKLVDGKLPPDDAVELHAAMRAAMREKPFILLKLNRAMARQKELETELAQYKESEPLNAGGQRRQAGQKPLSWEAEIDQLAAKRGR